MLRYLLIITASVVVFASECAKPVPFQISVDPRLIDEAKTKAKFFRPSLNLNDGTSETWIEGPPAENMTALAKYWVEEFDWFKFQDELNANNSHYYVTVPGGLGYDHPVPLHFVHERSTRNDAIPLLMLHGWPSTHYEWAHVIQPLVSPENNDTAAFHVVAPDFPGFGFSPAATFAGFGPRQAGKVFGNLMRTLGYTKYGIATTDAGWYVGLWMVHDEEEQLIGHFTDFWLSQPDTTDLERFAKNETDPVETRYISSFQAFENEFAAYMAIQSQSPLKVGQAMTDSPVGFAGWIWHHMQFCSDGYNYSFYEVITRTMLLWIPGAYGNIRIYTEWTKPENAAFPVSNVPTGVSEWGSKNGLFKNIENFALVPQSWIERISTNLKFFVTHDFGGHFPAEKQPHLYVQDVRKFFGGLKSLNIS